MNIKHKTPHQIEIELEKARAKLKNQILRAKAKGWFKDAIKSCTNEHHDYQQAVYEHDAKYNVGWKDTYRDKIYCTKCGDVKKL